MVVKTGEEKETDNKANSRSTIRELQCEARKDPAAPLRLICKSMKITKLHIRSKIGSLGDWRSIGTTTELRSNDAHDTNQINEDEEDLAPART